MATVKKVKKAQRGACVGSMSGAQRSRYFQGNAGPGIGQKIKDIFSGGKTKEERQEARAERKAARVEKKAAKAAPEAKSGLKVKKAQAGKMVPSEMKPGTMIKKADRDARATKMVDALDKQARKGSSARPMGLKFDKKSFDKVPSFDEYIKKTENKKVAPKKKMKQGGTVSMQLGSYDRQLGKNYTGKATVNKGAKAKMGKSVGKCKYGC
jgi:ATPase subunit of ABC transporter with duplicated ATPase domains